ncbi:hypothetical protein NDU88_003352 [Pleurodeles waltl]|uniref:Uncharacterized protein n=1 Tax=Pleurodeles waltl TaxID=8319 RepID=A0AAV7WR80_PLEWA|nr:hypothetical protein NDU88_003352 [Pleurodeles waltl]
MSRASSACLLPRVLTLRVRVGSADRLWQGTKKGLPKWSEPKQVVKVKKYSVVLNDGRKWNMVDVVKCWAKEV